MPDDEIGPELVGLETAGLVGLLEATSYDVIDMVFLLRTKTYSPHTPPGHARPACREVEVVDQHRSNVIDGTLQPTLYFPSSRPVSQV